MYISTENRLRGLSADIYRRKSQEDKRRQVLSLETQSDICDDLVTYWKVNVGKNYQESKSAKTYGQRLQFDQMMKRLENGTIEVIVCWKIDRLVRNMREGGWIIDLLQSGKLKAIVTKDKVYLPEDNTIITAIEMASATEYSRELGRKTQDGNKKKVNEGVPNNRATIGYLNNKHKLQGEKDWRDDPKRWKYLQRALRKILDDDISPFQAFKWLKEEIKLTTPMGKNSGGSLISTSVFYRFLKRPEIAGFFYYKGEKILINGCITPMINEDEFWRIQKRLGEKGIRITSKSISTYSHFIKSPEGYLCTPEFVNRVTCDCKTKFSIKNTTRCKKCGLDISMMKKPKFYSRRYYYNSYFKRNKIKAKGVLEKDIDKLILKIADQIEMNQTLAEWSKKFLAEIADDEIKTWKELILAQEDFFNRIENRKKKIKEAYLKGIFSIEEYQEEMKNIDNKLSFEKERVRLNDEWQGFLNSLISFGSEIKSVWKNGDVKQKRSLLVKLQSNFLWDDEKLSIIKPKWLEVLINGMNLIKTEYSVIEPKNRPIKQGDLSEISGMYPTWGRMWKEIQTAYLEKNNQQTNDFEV